MKNLLVWALSLFVVLLISCKTDVTPKVTDVEMKTDTASATLPPAEFADQKYADVVRNSLGSLSSGDIAAFSNSFSDNAVYAWNYGDSLAGKPAIVEYWTKRRADVIETLQFSDMILLPVKVNTPQTVEGPGVWVLVWHETTAKYKPTGKSMTQWIHSTIHFDANDKIDRWIQYVDRQLITQALTK